MAGTSTQQLITSVQTRLGGAANALTPDQYLDFINEAKDEFWSVLVTCENDYFLQSTTTTASQTNTFATLNTTTREYTLPSDCLRPRFIEITTSGYELVRFVFRPLSHPEFQQQRRESTANGSGSATNGILTYYYTVVGKNTLMLAAYPETAFTVKIWYVRSIPDLLISGSIDETVLPFPKKLVDYAVGKIQLVKDPAAWAAWKEAWKEDIVTLVEAAVPRSSTDPVFASDFIGGGE